MGGGGVVQAGSEDLPSVAQYYSSRLVAFVRKVKLVKIVKLVKRAERVQRAQRGLLVKRVIRVK